MTEKNLMPQKNHKAPNIFLTLVLLTSGVLLILFGVMKGDPARYLGGDTPILSIIQVLIGIYLLYCLSQYYKGK